MLLLNVILTFLLAEFFQQSKGNRTCIVTENGSRRENVSCDVSICDCCFQNISCPCHSLHCALQEVNGSRNVIINITTNVVLSSVVQLMNVNNISIVGHNYPVVNCNDTGALHFKSCHNITIKGIDWQRCGTYHNNPGLQMVNCSVAAITKSSFKFSIAQSLVLLNTKNVQISEYLLFEGNYNQAQHGGGIFISDYTELKFDNTSNVTFSNNTANRGSAMYITNNSSVVFDGKCLITDNNAIDDGTFYVSNHSIICFMEHSEVNFTNNSATQGGAIYLHSKSVLLTFCKEKCRLFFTDNKANIGGAIYQSNSNITFSGHSDVTFNYNIATFEGGAVYSHNNSFIKFQNNSIVKFTGNVADIGGAMHITMSSHIIFQDNSVVRLCDSLGFTFGGAIFLNGNSDVTFSKNCNIIFHHNQAGIGGAIFIHYNSLVDYLDTCNVLFTYNFGLFGGAIFISSESNVTFGFSSNITFINNNGSLGGALCFYHNSTIVFKAESLVEFRENRALHGGALYSWTSVVIFDKSCTVKSINNTANSGGFFYIYASTAIFTGNSSTMFISNRAFKDGGVMYLTIGSSVMFSGQCNATFSFNTASDYGGVIYINLDSNLIINTTNINFYNNTAALANNAFHIRVRDDCNEACLNNYIVDTRNKSFKISTSPKKLVLIDPAKRIDNENESTYDQYYINDIMLGQEIIINGCVLDYYNQSTDAPWLLELDISRKNEFYDIHGSENVLIACNHTFQGITVTGNIVESTLPSNISVNLTLHFDRNSESNSISVNLTVELSPCHPGFVYHAPSQKCKCYNAGDIVFCADSKSTIRRGYWFGSVNGQPTVTYCPVNYCNFTCCETTNGIYHLSPLRKNQCRLHRDGNACGSCEEGYTLSFDSAECVEVDKCTDGQKSLIIISSMLYWMVVVLVTFFLMHCQASIGYFYAIIYYYSVLDILLIHMHNVYLSEELNTIISVMSSTAKLLPQFLGRLCLVENMNEIDQQFIHYIHPLAVSFILAIISLMARCSYKVSSFISKDIIRVICLLLLLSYTSVTTTSLLLLQPLKFIDVDETYSYISPEIQYFQGRHLAYGVVAIICTIVIVLGLPLLLLLEPFLNSRISFVKIKPFLDQFQGCYKDNYRCFAGYYMICRLIIIIVLIKYSSIDFLGYYLLSITCTLMALIHLIIKPYASNILNVFDGMILQLMSFIVSTFDFNNLYSSPVTGMVYAIVIMPVILFCMMELFLYREKIKHIITAAVCKSKKYNRNVIREASINNYFDLIQNSFRTSRRTTLLEM